MDVETLVVNIRVNMSQLQNGLNQADRRMNSFISNAGRSISNMGASLTNVGRKLTTFVTLPILGLGVAAIKTSADFEQGMAKVQATALASSEDMKKLSDKAKEMGIKTKYSAIQSSEALLYMAQAGWKTQQMLDGLPGMLNLAAASGEDLGLVADILVDGLTALGMEAKDSGKFADVLAAAAAASNTNIAMLGETLKYAAPIFGTAGYNMKDFALAAGLMANSGIKALNICGAAA